MQYDNLGSVVAVTDNLGTLLEDSRYMPFGEVRSDVGSVPQTDKSFTGQKSLANTGLMDYNARMYSPELGRFIQPDTIVPGAGNSQGWNRFSYTFENPINITDPSGHRPCEETREGCGESQSEWRDNYKLAKLYAQSERILKRLGNRNDLEAMAQIVDSSYFLYGTYEKMMPALTLVFSGLNQSNPITIYNLAYHHAGGCAGVGRDTGDCPSNNYPGGFFSDKGFQKDYQDGHNQIFHFWSYLSTVVASDTVNHGFGSGILVSVLANNYHEIIKPDEQASWQDYALSDKAIVIGQYINLGHISPANLGDYLRDNLGETSWGTLYQVPILSKIFPLRGSQAASSD